MLLYAIISILAITNLWAWYTRSIKLYTSDDVPITQLLSMRGVYLVTFDTFDGSDLVLKRDQTLVTDILRGVIGIVLINGTFYTVDRRSVNERGGGLVAITLDVPVQLIQTSITQGIVGVMNSTLLVMGGI